MGTLVSKGVCCITRDDDMDLPTGAEDQGKKERFKSCICVQDVNSAPDADMLPSSRFGGARKCLSAMVDARFLDARAQVEPKRLGTLDDIGSLDTWWGIGTSTPDRRLEAAMPGHILATEVVDVMCMKTDDIANLRKTLPLDDVCDNGEKYLMWQLKFGSMCFVSLHHCTNDEVYEQIINADRILQDSLKWVVTPINLKVSVPTKGPIDAETIGRFFGTQHAHFSNPRNPDDDYEVAMISIDVFSVWSLRVMFPFVIFKHGLIVDIHLVSSRDNAVLSSYRAAMTPELIQRIKHFQ